MECNPPQLQETTVLNQCPTAQGNFGTLCQECDPLTPPCSLLLPRYSIHQAKVVWVHTDNRADAQLKYVHCGMTGRAYFQGLAIIGTLSLNCRLPSHPARDCCLPQRSRAGNLPVRTSVGATIWLSSS